LPKRLSSQLALTILTPFSVETERTVALHNAAVVVDSADAVVLASVRPGAVLVQLALLAAVGNLAVAGEAVVGRLVKVASAVVVADLVAACSTVAVTNFPTLQKEKKVNLILRNLL
jgi:hypothetical protein